ncbi:MAG: tRNA (N(6)-L-threonylcarbamoyladenosine(37)-C(2))-methylthiotransferase MtaB [Candidatus Eremiobacteraeota bacterium]|nr:tRNA (N(6)-L-threonylcarbamoyladenosine(37)-C(2))-methylthiotransferase MtaB [Candidatus Eremiobacteraeota bacterium]
MERNNKSEYRHSSSPGEDGKSRGTSSPGSDGNPSFRIITLGCKVNQYETDRIARKLCLMGFRLADEGESVDVCIINTCAVTSEASRKSRQAIRRLKRQSPDAVVFALGCAVEIKDGELFNLPEDIRYVGNDEKENFPEMIAGIFHGSQETVEKVNNSIISFGSPLHPPSKRGETTSSPANKGELEFSSTPATKHTRAYIKVQDGCDSFCSYCIIPYLRGRSRSRPPEEILEELKEIESAGYKEIVLTGIHMGDYGKGLDRTIELGDLVDYLAINSSIPRIRLSSLEPMDFSFKLLDVMKRHSRICHHLHLPLQHTSDKILKLMNRKYSIEEYDRIIQRAVEFFPDIAITTDVIIGFPGETDRDFRIMYEYVRSAPFSNLHCFPYSPRKGTAASKMEGIIASDVKKERLREILHLGKQKSHNFLDGFIGKNLSVLVEKQVNSKQDEKKTSSGKRGKLELFQGHTPNYISVMFKSQENLTGNIVCIKAIDRTGEKIYGERVESICDS